MIPSRDLSMALRMKKSVGRKRFWGYVVNVFDPINFDIDLIFPSDVSPDLIQQYSMAITNVYTYRNMNTENEDFTNFNEDFNEEIEEGSTYRCRLKGVGIQRLEKGSEGRSEKARLSREAHIAMIRQIDRQNGWVLVEISAVDIYRRLLVTIFDPITGDNLNSIIFRPEFEKIFIRHQRPNGRFIERAGRFHDKMETPKGSKGFQSKV